MLYAVDRKEIRTVLRSGAFMARFSGAEILQARYRTDPKVVAAVLPKPLTPPPDPLALAFVAWYPETSFGPAYNEGALFLDAVFNGETGLYCLAMPVTDDMAMVAGREYFGFPKKMADEIALDRDGGHMVGRVVRKGVEILRIEAELSDEIQPSESGFPLATDLDGKPCLKGVSFLYKYFPAATTRGFEHAPQLIRQVSLLTPRGPLESGAGKVEPGSTSFDPLGEIPVTELVAVSYGVFDTVMLPGKVVGRAGNPFRFARHALFKSDGYVHLRERGITPLKGKERRSQRKTIAAY